jgi:hypothetical protein
LAVTQIKAILFGAIDPLALITATVAIGLPAAAAFFWSVRRLRGAFAAA